MLKNHTAHTHTHHMFMPTKQSKKVGPFPLVPTLRSTFYRLLSQWHSSFFPRIHGSFPLVTKI